MTEDWRDTALCAQVGGELWFPEKGGSTRDAKRICNRCEVRAECLEYALDNDERFGIWGGLSERERRRLKRGQPPEEIDAPETVERVRQLAAGGLKDAQIGAQIGWKADRVYRCRRRNGISGGRHYRQPSGARVVKREPVTV